MARIYSIAVVLETFAELGRAIMRGVANYMDGGCSWELHSTPLGRNDAAILSAALRADGVITRPYTDEMAHVLAASGKPIVAVQYNGNLPIPHVGTNHTAIAKMAADHLMAQGFRQFAFFGAPDKSFSVRRARAFEQALSARGFTCRFHYAGRTDVEHIDWGASDPGVVKWLMELPKPTGMLVPNDFMARQLLLAAKHAKVRVPDEIAVVGVDNDELICRFTTPQLSSIDNSGERIGFTAAHMLDRLLQGKPLDNREVMVDPCRLVVRQSSDVLAVNDPNVAEALRFIRQNTAECLCVDRVLQEVAVSRRTLELLFRKMLGRSIQEEIMQSRVRKAKNLLIETELSITAITEASGFSTRTHMSEIFKQHTGHAPASFRREYRIRR